ncbi:uncharacterized protein [Phyllobates terribilis]|uniref:uncharacterized protein n=1 Tax=Phyllobates terribilis TaxID=111132 RepID=UPI003CCB4E9B
MSPVAGLILLLASSYVSSSVVPDYDSDPSVMGHGTYEGSISGSIVDVPQGASPDTKDIMPHPPRDHHKTLTVPWFSEKPGCCPADVDYPTCNPLIKVKPECYKDKDCNGMKKCCYSGCNQRCLLPLQAKLNPCPYFNHSICILVRPMAPECHKDDQCQGTERCCCCNCRRQCTKTEKVKPGQCPEPKKKIIATACLKDSDCVGSKKCCEQNGLKCVTPEQEYPGVCPISLEQLSCIYLNKTLCKRDCDCPPKMKCCLSEENNLQCQKVTSVKPGSCPIPVTRCRYYGPSKAQCLCDEDCPGDKKCCTPVCHPECTDPVFEVPEKKCPVVNTFVECQETYAPAECGGDRECGPGQKCCNVGCRMACRDV